MMFQFRERRMKQTNGTKQEEEEMPDREPQLGNVNFTRQQLGAKEGLP